MNASKLTLVLIFFLHSLIFSAQIKSSDVYYIFDNENKDYLLKTSGKYHDISRFYLYDKIEYQKRENKILEDKKKGKFQGDQFYNIPKRFVFSKIFGSKVKKIDNVDLSDKNIINTKWLIDNSWTYGKPNTLFKDLYFLLPIKNNKYLRFKVKQTVIAQ